MDEATAGQLRRFLGDVSGAANEAAITHRFTALVGELFPGSRVIREQARGIEKRVRIREQGRERNGFVDLLYGNVVIEFEHDLRKSKAVAESQLQEYVSSQWKERGPVQTPLIALASDGVRWHTYYPSVREDCTGIPTPKDVVLQPVRSLRLSENTLGEFYLWLTSLLFRPQRVVPTAEQFCFDFGAHSEFFIEGYRLLEAAWESVGSHPEAKLAFDTWGRYLSITYGSLPSGEGPLFLKHTYLASLARLLTWAALDPKTSDEPYAEVAQKVLSGDYFRQWQIDNMEDKDFFQWVHFPEAQSILAAFWERVLIQLHEYDVSRISEDVLKGAYQELVDPQDRHDLGEYYTPDWLCGQVVEALIPDEPGFPSVIDPTCGSGSFLRAAIAHLLETNKDRSKEERLRGILEGVVGIDIHPLAVTVARCTYLIAIRDLLGNTNRILHVPVYLADSLFLPAEVQQIELPFGNTGGGVPCYAIRFGGDREVNIPEELVRSPEAFDPAIRVCTEMAERLAQGNKDHKEGIKNFLCLQAPGFKDHPQLDICVDALWTFTKELADLIRERRDSIWGYVIGNAYRPAMLRDRFDYIVGNPPWLAYRYISEPTYQAEVKKRAVADYQIAPEEMKLFTQMELATVFFIHSLETFGTKPKDKQPGAKLAFVMPRSVMTADQHKNLRTRKFRASIELTALHDFKDVTPLFNVPCCVLYAKNVAQKNGDLRNGLPLATWAGKMPSRNLDWTDAAPYLTRVDGQGHLVFLGDRNAFSSKPGYKGPRKPSVYAKGFHQGATIVPRNFYFVQVDRLEGPPVLDGIYRLRTDPEQAKTAKPPYKDYILEGAAEGRYLYKTAIAKHVVPFGLIEPANIVLPMDSESSWKSLLNGEQLRIKGYFQFAKWIDQAEEYWNRARGSKAKQASLFEWLNHQNKLTRQNPKQRYLVLYNAAGTHLAATQVDRQALQLPFVVDAKLYWTATGTRQHSDYLAAALNSPIINETIKPFQSQGLMGERDIHKKVLDIPIPYFTKDRPLHQHLAKLGRQAATEVARLIKREKLPGGIGPKRTAVRKAIAPTLEKIDKAVAELLEL